MSKQLALNYSFGMLLNFFIFFHKVESNQAGNDTIKHNDPANDDTDLVPNNNKDNIDKTFARKQLEEVAAGSEMYPKVLKIGTKVFHILSNFFL